MHDLFLDSDACPMIDADRTNVDKHAQPVKHFAPFRARGSDQMSVRCVVDTICYQHSVMQHRQVDVELSIDIGVETDRSRVDHNVAFWRQLESRRQGYIFYVRGGLGIEQRHQISAVLGQASRYAR